MEHISPGVCTFIALLLTGVVFAGESMEQKKDRRGPPVEALEACAAAVDGDDCSFEGRRGENVAGQCAVDRGEQLACRPDNPPPRLKRRDDTPEESDADTAG